MVVQRVNSTLSVINRADPTTADQLYVTTGDPVLGQRTLNTGDIQYVARLNLTIVDVNTFSTDAAIYLAVAKGMLVAKTGVDYFVLARLFSDRVPLLLVPTDNPKKKAEEVSGDCIKFLDERAYAQRFSRYNRELGRELMGSCSDCKCKCVVS